MNSFKNGLNQGGPTDRPKFNPVRKFKGGGWKLIPLIVAFTLGCIGLQTALLKPPSHHNVIYLENLKPGTTRWQSPVLTSKPTSIGSADDVQNGGGKIHNNIANTASTWANTSISGYANATSINHGSAINFFVGTTLPGYNIEIYRMGWYGGTGARLIQTVSNLPGQNQPVPPADPTTGLLQLNWAVSYTLQTDTTWVTGAYLAKLIGSDGSVAYIPFVVRDDSSSADILYQIPVNTYQAYNNWGGKSLYDYNSTGGRAYKISLDRPYAQAGGAGGFFDGDYNMIRFLESQGYNMSYATSIDTQSNPSLLNNHKLFLSNYHDEYWSKPMRDNITAALNQGKNLAFFDADSIYWQIRYESSTNGVPNRVITCYKSAALDPMSQANPALTTVRWRDNPVNQPENALLGVMFASALDYGNTVPWVVNNANHWVYSGTGLNNGDSIAGLVGYEFDQVWNNGQTPGGLVVLSNSPVTDPSGVAYIANGSIYTYGPGNALVFTAGTVDWSWKVDDNTDQSHGADPRVQRMTENILNAMIAGVPTATATPTSTTTSTSTPTTTPTSTPTSTATSTPTPTPTSTPLPALPYTVYDESLVNGWLDYSDHTANTLNFADTTAPYMGKYDLSWVSNVGYSYVNLYNKTPFNTTGYTYITLAVQVTQAMPKVIAIRLVNSSGASTGTVYLANYSGDPVVGSYTIYKIPLTALNAANMQIIAIHFRNMSGTAQPMVFIDRVGFTN